MLEELHLMSLILKPIFKILQKFSGDVKVYYIHELRNHTLFIKNKHENQIVYLFEIKN